MFIITQRQYLRSRLCVTKQLQLQFEPRALITSSGISLFIFGVRWDLSRFNSTSRKRFSTRRARRAFPNGIYSIVLLFRETATMNIDDRATNEIVELTGVTIGRLIESNAHAFSGRRSSINFARKIRAACNVKFFTRQKISSDGCFRDEMRASSLRDLVGYSVFFESKGRLKRGKDRGRSFEIFLNKFGCKDAQVIVQFTSEKRRITPIFQYSPFMVDN